MLEEILKLHQAGQLDEAEQRYREWLSFNPDDADALHLLAIVRRQRDDLAEALALAQRAVDLAPDRANFQLSLAGLLLHARQFAAARERFATALRLNPNQPGAALGIAQIAALQGDLAAAQEALAKAERMAPEHPQVLNQKAGLALLRGDHQSALKWAIQAAKRNPDDAGIQATLARSFAAQGQSAFAEQALRNAIAQMPSFTMGKVALAQMLFKTGRIDEAGAQFQQVLEEHPEHALALAGRADIAYGRGDFAGALVDYRAAHAGAPANTSIASSLVQALMATGASAEGQELLTSLLARFPASDDLHRLAIAIAARESSDRYLSACRTWVAAAPTQLEAQERLATALEMLGRHDEADTLATTSLQQDSRAAYARLILARSALRKGSPADAQEQINRLPEANLSLDKRVDRAMLRGLARDRLDDHAGALDAWLSGHRLQTGLAPLVNFPDPSAWDAPLLPPTSATGPAPTFLIGLPGAGTESLVALLRQTGLHVLSDRFGQRMRADAIATGEFVAMAEQLAADPTQAERFRERYLAGVAAVDEVLSPNLIDWLPFYDLRLATVIEAAFPNARYLVVVRDVRDCLLTWLAMGTPQSLGLTDTAQAAAWLARVLTHFDRARTRIAANRQLLISAAEFAQPAVLAPRVLTFLGARPDAGTVVPDEIRVGRGGLPTVLPDGRWRAYIELLAPAFSHFA